MGKFLPLVLALIVLNLDENQGRVFQLKSPKQPLQCFKCDTSTVKGCEIETCQPERDEDICYENMMQTVYGTLFSRGCAKSEYGDTFTNICRNGITTDYGKIPPPKGCNFRSCETSLCNDETITLPETVADM